MNRSFNPFKALLMLPALCLAFMATAQAQDRQSSVQTVIVSGTVVDESGQPAVGATVSVDGRTGMGVVADSKGAFRIQAPVRSTLRVSYMGYADQTRTVTADLLDWQVQLAPDENFLEDAVVVGYGVQKKESVVGAISTVSAEQLSNTGTQDLASALTGKVSGMLTSVTNGAPGYESTSIMLRGLSSFSASGNSPLVLVDGVERSMATINPAEVQSVSVLKDASATAVFGSKGANGVILVTTKTGREGRAKMHATAEMGLTSALWLPEHISSVKTIEMANVALKNDQSFSALYPQSVIDQYLAGTNPYRYPDIDWYKTMMNTFAPSYNASFDISGGSKRIKYYAMASYYHQGSLIKSLNELGPVKYTQDRISYRLNLNAALTKTTELILRFGGAITINNSPGTSVNVNETNGSFFDQMYMASGALFPAYWPADIYEQYPDPNYPDASGIRLSNNAGQSVNNPYSYLLHNQWIQNTQYKVLTDLAIKQDLSFITKGLSAKATVSLTSSYQRKSESADQTLPLWNIDWDRYDLGAADIWDTSTADPTYVYTVAPLSVSMSTDAASVVFSHYIEGSLNYARKFGGHEVTGTAVYNQRQYNSGTSSPARNQSFVSRVTYNYLQKYLFEANLGITGSEQFAPGYRYGIFPSVAAGYTVSKEKFWKRALPWWSTMKVRFSWGLVGSDVSTSGFLYYTTYQLVTYHGRSHYKEDSAANDGARWETADKKDLGIEMGFLKDKLNVNVDLFDEYRYDMLMKPVTTPLVGVAFKEVNAGALKKHGLDIDILWRESLKSGWHYSVGALLGLNENRILKYADIPYNPEYKKYANTPTLSQRTGSTLIDDKYFQTINELHGYPAYTANWSNLIPGVYKFMDYLPDGTIADDDLHVIRGSSYPPCTYGLNFSVGYKGFTLKMVGTGTIGKYIQFKRAYMIPFANGDLRVHEAQLDYWSPTNRDATAPVLTYVDAMYAWGGGSVRTPGYNLALEGYTWRKSDYFSISELYLGYKFDSRKLQKKFGIDALTVKLTCNNLYLFTDLIDGNPQAQNTATSYYPLTRTVKLGASVNF